MKRPAVSALELRCATRQADLAVISEAVLRACPVCGCTYLDFPDGCDAHHVVFGHRPEAGA